MTEPEPKSITSRDSNSTAPHEGRGWLTAQDRQRLWTWLVGGTAGASLLVAGGSAMLYLQQRVWQNLALTGLAVVALGLLLWVRRFVLSAPSRIAYGLLGACLLLYGGAVALFQGVSGYAWGGLGLMVLAVSISLLPRRWEAWLGSSLGVGLLIGLLDAWTLIPRIAASTQSPALIWLLLSGYSVYWVTLVWGVGHWIDGLSIRNRMVVASFVSVLLTVAAVSAASVWLGWSGVQRHVLDRLELAADLRESQIDTWVDTLQTDLDVALLEGDADTFALYILEEYAGIEATTPVTIPAEIVSGLETRLNTAQSKTQTFQHLLVINVHGQVVASTDPQQRGRNYAAEPFFIQGRLGFNVSWSSATRSAVMVSSPIYAEGAETHTASGAPIPALGVLVGQTGLGILNGIMSKRTGLGDTGAAYLDCSNYLALTESGAGEIGRAVRTPGTMEAVTWKRDGSGLYVNAIGVPLVEVYHWQPRLSAALIVQQEQREAFRELYITVLLNAGIALLALLLSVGVALLITRSIVRPLVELTDTATEIAGGNLARVVHVMRQDEIGRLGQAFNSMTDQLREAFRGLEERVAQRTHDLQRRSRYLEASSEVGRAVSSILNTEQLIREVVDLILERFDLYYVGLFLTRGESAVLRAGTGEAGRAMLAREHHIRIGEGMIGWSIAHNQARIASKAEADAVRVTNPELPDTRSEAALPLRSRGQVLGALSVQSAVPNAFDEDTISVLQTMADLVAVALDNARLFADAQEALEAERRAYGQHTREVWMTMMRANKMWNYTYVREGGDGEEPSVMVAQGEWDDEMRRVYQTNAPLAKAAHTSAILTLPLRTSGQVVGVLRFERTGSDVMWMDDEVALLETLTDQLGQTLERAQLYLETQQRAMRDRLVADLAGRMRESLDIDTVLRTTVREIFEAMDFASVEVRLGSELGAEGVEREVAL